MLALVRHLCPCGTPYVVSLAGEDDLRDHPEWQTAAVSAAQAVEESFVDGRAPGFFCADCSRLHLRVADSTSVQVSSGDPLLSISLN